MIGFELRGMSWIFSTTRLGRSRRSAFFFEDSQTPQRRARHENGGGGDTGAAQNDLPRGTSGGRSRRRIRRIPDLIESAYRCRSRATDSPRSAPAPIANGGDVA